MAKKKKQETDGGDDSGSAGGKLKAIIGAIVLVVVGVALGSQVLGGGGEQPANAMAPTTTTTEPPGIVTSMDTITLNLADGRFLKVGVSFEVHRGESYPDTDPVDPNTKGFARELDATIRILSSYNYEQLITTDGKLDAKQRLVQEARRLSDDAIKDVLFHEFVMQ